MFVMMLVWLLNYLFMVFCDFVLLFGVGFDCLVSSCLWFCL